MIKKKKESSKEIKWSFIEVYLDNSWVEWSITAIKFLFIISYIHTQWFFLIPYVKSRQKLIIHFLYLMNVGNRKRCYIEFCRAFWRCLQCSPDYKKVESDINGVRTRSPSIISKKNSYNLNDQCESKCENWWNMFKRFEI